MDRQKWTDHLATQVTWFITHGFLFVGGPVKDHVYETPVNSEMELVAWIVAAAGIVRDMPGVFENVQRSMQRHCEFCVRVNFNHN